MPTARWPRQSPTQGIIADGVEGKSDTERVPLTDNGIYIRVVARTREGLGQAVNSHLFRDCAATSIAIEDPAHVGIASQLLGHPTDRRRNATTSRHAASIPAAPIG